ncbi:MAG: hypothetical protein SGJ27_26035 [Candidatus Melainabacteria bacterium]|nr:hypothetical protein [Candidatus Melainabacteria bacterium]
MSDLKIASESAKPEVAKETASILFQDTFTSPPRGLNKVATDPLEFFIGYEDKNKSANLQLQELPFLQRGKNPPPKAALEKSLIVAPTAQPQQPRAARELTLKEFVEEGQKLLPKLDLDKNGTVSHAELTKAIVNPEFKGMDAQTLGFLHAVQTLSTPDSFLSKQRELETPGHPALGSPDGVSKKTLDQIKEMKLAFDTNVWAGQGGLSAYDASKDGSISRAELDAKRIDFNRMASILGAKLVIAKDKNPAQDSFSIPDTVARIQNDHERGLSKVTNNYSLLSLEQAAEKLSKNNLPEKLFGTPDNPLKSIVPDAIKQGLNQNCVFLSTLSWVAASKPDSIAKMIEMNPDGKTLTVKFPGDPLNKITVPRPTEAELRLSNAGGKNGYWVNALESAFGKYQQLERKIDLDEVPMMAGFTHIDKGFSQTQKESIQLLTGQKFLSATFTQDVSLTDLADIIKDGISCAAYTPGDRSPATKDGFVKQHAYTILSFDPKGPDSGTVKLRNPVGVDGNPRDPRSGTSTLSLKDFKSNFSFIFLAGKDKAPKAR